MIDELDSHLTESPDLIELIHRAIVDEPPLAVKEGGLIRDGFDPNLDELHAASRGGKDWIAQLKQKEVERTGIASLKVGFTSVFGYFIEVTKANLAKVPPDYIRKQTIANGERFITPELKAMEGKILGAEERAMKLEYELFLRVREEVIGVLTQIQQTASALAQLDVLRSTHDQSTAVPIDLLLDIGGKLLGPEEDETNRPTPRCDFDDGVHVGNISVEIDRNDGSGSGRNTGFEGTRRDAPRHGRASAPDRDW